MNLTITPFCTKALAIAAPMPALAPVTIATFPCHLSIFPLYLKSRSTVCSSLISNVKWRKFDVKKRIPTCDPKG